MGVCGVEVLVSFLCGMLVNKIRHCGVVVFSKPTVCNDCAFKPMVFGETKLFAVLRHQQYQHSLHPDHAAWTLVWLCDVFLVRKIVEIMTLIILLSIISHADVFPFFRKPYRPC